MSTIPGTNCSLTISYRTDHRLPNKTLSFRICTADNLRPSEHQPEQARAVLNVHPNVACDRPIKTTNQPVAESTRNTCFPTFARSECSPPRAQRELRTIFTSGSASCGKFLMLGGRAAAAVSRATERKTYDYHSLRRSLRHRSLVGVAPALPRAVLSAVVDLPRGCAGGRGGSRDDFCAAGLCTRDYSWSGVGVGGGRSSCC